MDCHASATAYLNEVPVVKTLLQVSENLRNLLLGVGVHELALLDPPLVGPHMVQPVLQTEGRLLLLVCYLKRKVNTLAILN